MPTRSVMHVFWWFLLRTVSTVDRLETVAIVPVFPGEIVYFMAGNTMVDSSEERRESGHGYVDDTQPVPSQRRCSVTLLTIRTLTLAIAIGFLLLHQRLCYYMPGSHNCTTERTN